MALVPSEDYPYHLEIQPNDEYHLYWKFDAETVTFELHVRTTGWVGFGISPTGGMVDADIMIGWVADDVASITVSRFGSFHID